MIRYRTIRDKSQQPLKPGGKLLTGTFCGLLVVVGAVSFFGVAPTAYGAQMREINRSTTAVTQRQVRQILKFTLDFIGTEEQRTSTGPWSSIHFSQTPKLNRVRNQISQPQALGKRGEAYFSDITVKGPFSRERKAVTDWINSFARSDIIEIKDGDDMEIRWFNPRGETVAEFTLCQALPLSYQPPPVSSDNHDPLAETLTFQVNNILRKSPGQAGINRGNIGVTSKLTEFNLVNATNGANDSDKILFGGRFKVEIGGEDVTATAFAGGGVTFEKKEAGGGDRPAGRNNSECQLRQFTITKVNWQNITLERLYAPGATHWGRWFEAEQAGRREFKNVTVTLFKQRGRAQRTSY